MIHDLDRVGYIGASDTKYVMMKWDTKTFKQWWRVKIGLEENPIDNIYTRAGNAYEGKILDALEIDQRDRQIIVGRLRVNLDGETDRAVIEVKTYQYLKGFKMYKHYLQQVQVEMYATNKDRCLLYAYGLLPSEYEEYGEVDINRLSVYPIDYDEGFINKYLPRLNELSRCIREGDIPSESNIKELQ